MKGKVAIVSGGAGGIGAAICKGFAREGARVAVADVDLGDALAVAKDIAGNGDNAMAAHVDVTDDASVKALMDRAEETFGGIDILFNCAGGSIIEDTLVTDVDLAVWDRTIPLDLKGPFLCCRHGIPKLKARGGGKIINIGSIFGEDGFPGSSGYCASKGAIKQLTRSLCLELRPFNIQVNTLSPGCIETDLNKKYREESEDFTRALQERFGAGNPWLQPEEMAGTAVFLASSDADSVTGANVMVDRGYSAY